VRKKNAEDEWTEGKKWGRGTTGGRESGNTIDAIFTEIGTTIFGVKLGKIEYHPKGNVFGELD
jgi:hypothetical protein